MKKLINQVQQAVNYWGIDTELHKRLNHVITMWEKGYLTPVDFAKELTSIYDESMTAPF